MKYDVFISYSSKNQKIVEAMCAYLEQYKIRCFVAYRDIPKGVVWAKAIVDALDESKMMVVVFSEEFNLSDQVDREIELASEDKKPILTFRVSDTMFKGAKKYYLKNINWIDAFPDPEKLFDSLLDNVIKLIGPSALEKERQEREARAKAEQERIEKERREAEERRLEKERQEREAKAKAEQEKNKQFPKTINGHEYVDLGLSVKWATCNVGASSPEDYGNYYAWGETKTKSDYSDSNRVTYSKIGGDSRYDAARANWGGSWRIPTKAELEELKDNCTWTWMTQCGKNGYRLTGPNGNSIFLPAAGYRYRSSLYDAGEGGRYCGSTPHGGFSHLLWLLSFDSGKQIMHCGERGLGFSVRPVAE